MFSCCRQWDHKVELRALSEASGTKCLRQGTASSTFLNLAFVSSLMHEGFLTLKVVGFNQISLEL